MKTIIKVLAMIFVVHFACNPVRMRASAAEAEAPQVLTLELGIRPAAYKKLINDSEQINRSVYLCCGDTIETAKIKIKGATSRIFAQASVQKKIPFNISQSKNGTLAALFQNSSVNFANCATPRDLMADHIALKMFEYMGIPVPKNAFVFIRFNGIDFGLYYATEDLNTTFFRNHFTQPLGSSYKFANEAKRKNEKTYDSDWFKQVYIKQNRGSERYLSLVAALEKGSGYEEYLNIDEVLRFFACAAACGSGPLLNEHNNYVLFDDGGRFILIPWDLDAAFTPDDQVNGIDHFMLDDYEGEESPLFTLLMQNSEYRDRYHAYLREICTSFLEPTVLRPYLERLTGVLKPYFQRDVAMYFNSADTAENLLTAEVFSDSSFAFTVEKIRQSVLQQLAGEADLYYYDPDLAAFSDVDDTDAFFSRLEQYSPLLQKDIAIRIPAAYAAWKQAHLKELRSAVYNEYAVSAAVFVLGFAVVGISVLFRRRKNAP